ncbi:ABC transporter ATP-binding protein [Miniphocaeibacter massiliensis]|uniref:ABC transporter ATP-binding protein n=1 Tax=Miniphocaeibacter massiliensis TaxID=2041841 RepID=UPI000C1C3B29|nr:ABC transporter ATP-binding protein [Miniphocaeibacter massiliensis]
MNSFKRLFSYIKPYKFRFSISMFFSILYTFTRSSQPFLIGLAISQVAKDIGNDNPINLNYIFFIVVLLAITSILDTIGDYFSNYILSDVVQKSMRDIRNEINIKINLLPVSYFDKHKQGDLLNRITTDVDVVSNAMQQGALKILTSILILLFSIVFMFIRSPFFALIACVIFPICFLIYKFLYKKSQPLFNELQDSLGDLNAYTTEHLSAYEVIQLFGQEEIVINDFKKINKRIEVGGFKSNFMASITNPILNHIVHLAYIGLFIVIAMTILNKPLYIGGFLLASSIDVGGLQSFIQYVWQASSPIQDITQLSNVFQAAVASWKRVIDFLDEKEEIFEDLPVPMNLESAKGNVNFNHIAFGYSENKLLMKDVSINVKSGQKIAVVGATGAGKTTLINLLMRFYDLNGGSITIDGVDMNKFTKSQSRSLFGLVLQDPWLYHDTIANNIRFGNLDATDEEIVEAAKIANVDHYINTLPQGYNTILNEESSNISQGQKQLITIARALVKNPKILILDEATSSVDTRLEVLIQKAMENAMKNRTSFVIAHRLSTIRDANLILVMSNGSIVEQGTHEELLSTNGTYKELYESQFSTGVVE